MSVRLFSYGSNMLLRRIRARTPSARKLCLGVLRGFQLAFHKRGADGSGKCNVHATGDPSDAVYGVVASVDAAEIDRLHGVEGRGRGYSFETLSVQVEGRDRSVNAYVAMADFIDDSLRPFDWYQAFVVQGALENRLPACYVSQIVSVRSEVDPDRTRQERNLGLLSPRVMRWLELRPWA